MKKIYNEIKEEKELYISMCQKYFELFKNNGYAFKLYFIDRKIKRKLNVYIIAEIRDVNNEKKVRVLIYKVLVYDYVTDRLRLCNNNLENALARILNKLDKTGKLNAGFTSKFKLFLVDKKTFEKYYKDYISIIILIFFIAFMIIIGILRAKTRAHFYSEVFGFNY
jgi:hypothetical protein